ncbi:bifunctional isocitrate dehydrogenase kinase/phosphatase [Escherichia coli]|nr:bifunctional isocitrate dehydrogenase kinase/phosphatase [Escherichia coli]
MVWSWSNCAALLTAKVRTRHFLLRVKEHYTRLLPDYPHFEIAESFFNSVYCRLFDHRSLTPERLFYL